MEAAVKPANCHVGQRVLYAGRPCVVSAIAGDRAVIAYDGEFRTVPIAVLEPALLRDGQLEGAIRNLGADAGPDPDWQQKVWRGIDACSQRQRWVAIALAVALAAIAAWLVLA
jgi:hypothetical protein